MTPEQKAWIDQASYKELLAKWRFEPMGSPLFQDEAGRYFARVMEEKRAAAPLEAVAASKSIGWDATKGGDRAA